MKRAVSVLLAAVAAPMLALATIVAQQSHPQKGGIDETGPYDVVENWFKPLHDGRSQCALGVFAESADRIYVATEVEVAASVPAGNCTAERSQPGSHSHFLLVVDRNGKTVEEWSQWSPLFGLPHSIKMNPYDPEKHVWVVNRDAHQIHEFTHDGKQLVHDARRERRVRQRLVTHFNLPADITFLPGQLVLRRRRLRQLADREVRQEGQVSRDMGHERIEARASSRCRTASLSMPSAASMSPTATTGASRFSTNTASISTSGRTSAAWSC